jgi:hypothetical protein
MNLPDRDISLAVMVVHLLPLTLLITLQKTRIAYVLEKYESAQKIKKVSLP